MGLFLFHATFPIFDRKKSVGFRWRQFGQLICLRKTHALPSGNKQKPSAGTLRLSSHFLVQALLRVTWTGDGP